jgi:outer membrane protein
MSHRVSMLVGVLGLVVGAGGAGAAQDAPLPLTLEDAIARGLEASHRLAEATARREGASAVADQRRAASQPFVSAQAGYTRTNHVDEFGVPLPNNQLRVIYPDIPDNYRTRLDVQWPVATGGRLTALEGAARSEAAALSSEVDAVRADVRLDVARAYWNLVVSMESQRVVEDALLRTGAHLRDVKNQLAAGLVAPSDVLSVEAQESRQRMLGIQAGARVDVAQAELARLVGAPPGTAIRPVSPLVASGSGDDSIEALVNRARESRPERAALLDRIRAAEQRERAASAATRPTIAIGGGVDYGRPNARIFPREGAWRESWDASVNVTWPLFDGGRARADVAEASAAVRAVEARLAEFDAVLAVELRQRISELRASRAAIAAADDAVRAATEARRVVGERFAAGVATSTDVLIAQGAVLQAQFDRTQALADARLAEARLARALGL